jgi:Ser/Thr protein kinase RdoA (MazF antagonist)
MDDRYAYLLNGLWARHFDLGRVVRFRHAQRGRQAITYEVLTAEQREYCVYLFPPSYAEADLAAMAQTINTLDQNRFSVVPMQQSKDQTWVVGGPQGQHMMVSLNTDGQLLPPETWSAHDISQLGLRLAWMHRLLKEEIPAAAPTAPLAEMLSAALQRPPADLPHRMPKLNPAYTQRLVLELSDHKILGPCHGDIQPAAFLLDHDRQIRTVVDWGLLHAGDPLEDMVAAFVHWCIAADGTVNTETARTLLESYRSLIPISKERWLPAVRSWCAWQILHATADHAPLAKNFAHILQDPGALAQAIELCEAK